MLESEVTFIITTVNSDAILNEISSLESIGKYLFSPMKQETIQDTYLDTNESTLKSQRMALRIRLLNDQPLISLKGPDHPNQWGGVNRMEIEDRWSLESFEGICAQLKENGISVSYEKHLFMQDDPIATLTQMHFRVIQKRDTHRTKKDVRIIISDNYTEKFAELAIDTCRYYVRNTTIQHIEIEMEMTSDSHQAHMGPLVNTVILGYKPLLKIWPHNKLITGEAITHLYATGKLSHLAGNHNRLDPKAYALIHQHLSTP